MPLYDTPPMVFNDKPARIVQIAYKSPRAGGMFIAADNSGRTDKNGNGSASSSPHAESNINLASSTQFTDIEVSGPIQKVSMPASWKKTGEAPYGASYHIMFISPLHKDLAISLDSYGHPLGYAATVLRGLCRSQPKLIYSSSWAKQGRTSDSAREKNAAHIVKQLVGVLEQGGDGNNQFTNPKNPLYQIDKLEVKSICGKLVLCMDGYFTGKGGSPPKLYSSVVHIPDVVGGGVVVHSLRYQAINQEVFYANKIFFDKTLSSIRWQPWYKQ